jgi:hypothetical protein
MSREVLQGSLIALPLRTYAKWTVYKDLDLPIHNPLICMTFNIDLVESALNP